MSDAQLYPRPYLRDGVPGLTMKQQEAIRMDAGIDLTRGYRDALKKAACRRRDPADLVQRALLLRPTSRRTPEMIYVAGLRVIGWSMSDVTRALAAAGRRNASVHAVDIGKTFTAATLEPELLEAIADAEEARRRGQTAAARSAGVEAAAAKRKKARDAKLAIARAEWIKPPGEVSGTEIASMIGVSLRSLHKWLGPRGEAREKATRRVAHV